jgi:hypothetical protein
LRPRHSQRPPARLVPFGGCLSRSETPSCRFPRPSAPLRPPAASPRSRVPRAWTPCFLRRPPPRLHALGGAPQADQALLRRLHPVAAPRHAGTMLRRSDVQWAGDRSAGQFDQVWQWCAEPAGPLHTEVDTRRPEQQPESPLTDASSWLMCAGARPGEWTPTSPPRRVEGFVSRNKSRS